MTPADPEFSVALLGGFQLSVDRQSVDLPLGAQRLLAYLAVGERTHRALAAERLWPDCLPRRVAANLRSALWRARAATSSSDGLVYSAGPRIRLGEHVVVDLNDMHARARNPDRYAIRAITDRELEMLLDVLNRELLPGWSDEWLLIARERWNQVRLHTLESLAEQLLAAEQYLPAMDTALMAVSIEPIREAAHRTIIEIHTAEGNLSSALTHYQQYRALLQRELATTPSERMLALVRAILPK
jgi:DNA-binding SARP family transcriptional activator